MMSFEEEVEERIGVKFKKPEMLHEAFVHRSYMNEYPADGQESNERLEFFGDAVLSYVVAERLFRDCPALRRGRPHGVARLPGAARQPGSFRARSEGSATSSCSVAAKRPPAAASALRTSRACSRPSSAPSAIDRGLTAWRASSSSTPSATSSTCEGRPTPIDPKSKLQEVVQARWQRAPSYRTVHEEGPEHRKVFTVEVQVHGEALAQRQRPQQAGGRARGR